MSFFEALKRLQTANSQHIDGVKLTQHPTLQCLANPLRNVIITPFQEPLGPQAELGWCESPEAQPTGYFGTSNPTQEFN